MESTRSASSGRVLRCYCLTLAAAAASREHVHCVEVGCHGDRYGNKTSLHSVIITHQTIFTASLSTQVSFSSRFVSTLLMMTIVPVAFYLYCVLTCSVFLPVLLIITGENSHTRRPARICSGAIVIFVIYSFHLLSAMVRP